MEKATLRTLALLEETEKLFRANDIDTYASGKLIDAIIRGRSETIPSVEVLVREENFEKATALLEAFSKDKDNRVIEKKSYPNGPGTRYVDKETVYYDCFCPMSNEENGVCIIIIPLRDEQGKGVFYLPEADANVEIDLDLFDESKVVYYAGAEVYVPKSIKDYYESIYYNEGKRAISYPTYKELRYLISAEVGYKSLELSEEKLLSIQKRNEDNLKVVEETTKVIDENDVVILDTLEKVKNIVKNKKA